MGSDSTLTYAIVRASLRAAKKPHKGAPGLVFSGAYDTLEGWLKAGRQPWGEGPARHDPVSERKGYANRLTKMGARYRRLVLNSWSKRLPVGYHSMLRKSDTDVCRFGSIDPQPIHEKHTSD